MLSDSSKVVTVGGVNDVPWEFRFSFWRPPIKRSVVVVCVVVCKEKLLLVRSGDGWNFPRIKIDRCEDLNLLLNRELGSELGVAVQKCKPIGYKKFGVGKVGILSESELYYSPYFAVRATKVKSGLSLKTALVGLGQASKLLESCDNNDVIAYQAYRRRELLISV